MSAPAWHYSGDGNLEYGGVFIDLSDWRWGYCNAVRVTDLDGCCGFPGACAIEHVTISIREDRGRAASALRSCGSLSWLLEVADGPDEERFRALFWEQLLGGEEITAHLVYADWLEEHGVCRARWERKDGEEYDPRGSDELRDWDSTGLRLLLAESILSACRCDHDDGWDSGRPGFGMDHTEIVQLEADGPMAFEGWRVDKRLRNADLMGYVKAVHLKGAAVVGA